VNEGLVGLDLHYCADHKCSRACVALDRLSGGLSWACMQFDMQLTCVEDDAHMRGRQCSRAWQMMPHIKCDAKECIAYLTTSAKGDLALDEQMSEGLGKASKKHCSGVEIEREDVDRLVGGPFDQDVTASATKLDDPDTQSAYTTLLESGMNRLVNETCSRKAGLSSSG